VAGPETLGAGKPGERGRELAVNMVRHRSRPMATGPGPIGTTTRRGGDGLRFHSLWDTMCRQFRETRSEGGPTDLAKYCVNAVLGEGRSVRAVAASTGRSKSWVHPHAALYRAGGEVILPPLKRRTQGARQPHLGRARGPDRGLARAPGEDGLDAGAGTSAWRLSHEGRCRLSRPSITSSGAAAS